ncbi:response regulator [Azospirillum sp.]|uniref:response regulator n=1 Tax=Azospirillum sp. TaxID=34012 RepID=UPI002D3F58EC|nr:response regulator [Azospirillum sp.]HYD66898.1 response regulator [Azospirillum sp.]
MRRAGIKTAPNRDRTVLPDPYRRLEVLVVEDMAPMRTLLRGLLRQLGVATVVEAANARDAFDAIRTRPPDVVITDWHMPGGSGIDLLTWIRHDPASPNPVLPVILLTARGDLQHVATGRDAGATDFLVKPVSLKTLALRLKVVVELPRVFVLSPGFCGPDRRRKQAPVPGRNDARGSGEEQAILLPPSPLLQAKLTGDDYTVLLESRRVAVSLDEFRQRRREAAARDIDELCAGLDEALRAYGDLDQKLRALAVPLRRCRDRAAREGRVLVARVVDSLAGVLAGPFQGALTARMIQLHVVALAGVRRAETEADARRIADHLAADLEALAAPSDSALPAAS